MSFEFVALYRIILKSPHCVSGAEISTTAASKATKRGRGSSHGYQPTVQKPVSSELSLVSRISPSSFILVPRLILNFTIGHQSLSLSVERPPASARVIQSLFVAGKPPNVHLRSTFLLKTRPLLYTLCNRTESALERHPSVEVTAGHRLNHSKAHSFPFPLVSFHIYTVVTSPASLLPPQTILYTPIVSNHSETLTLRLFAQSWVRISSGYKESYPPLSSLLPPLQATHSRLFSIPVFFIFVSEAHRSHQVQC
ncbi:uncharacterized protein LOC135164529 [Diachasmimorpha longicaudata]|uniref:uncharacterized protein LOC135164529 n=1 Tax=Diachasmimorpha longicaudata TaxID=58733 RepID=UPI0030B87E38